MRGAATAAQAAMRANLGRSATPELAMLHHHETRVSSRRVPYDMREESVAEPTSLIVRLRISREKYRQWMRNYKSRPQGEYQQAVHISTPLMASQSNTPQHPSMLSSSAMPPPPSPVPPPRSNAAGSSRSTPNPEPQSASGDKKWRYYPDGRVDAPFPKPEKAEQPPPPPWLREALEKLRAKYPSDDFEAWMKPIAVDKANNGEVVRTEQLQNVPLEERHYAYFPRIRCNDCPGKQYTAAPANAAENFEIHLKNRQHMERVHARTKGKAK